MKQSRTPAKQPKRKAALIAAPLADVVDDVESDGGDDDDDDDDDGGGAKAKVESSSSLPRQKKPRSDKNQKRTKVNKLQFANGVKRIKVNSKWIILDPNVSMFVCV